MTDYRTIGALTAVLLAAGAGTASAVTVVDYSFETPAQGPGGYVYGPVVAGAVFSGGSGVQINGSAWGFAPAPDGVQTAFLQTNAQISLDVSGLTAGGIYSVTFDDSQRPNYGLLPIAVQFDGATILTTTPGTTWAPVTTATFVATGTTGTLAFITASTDGVDRDSGVDNIAISGAVPESATWALMLVGFGALGGALRARRSVTAAS